MAKSRSAPNLVNSPLPNPKTTIVIPNYNGAAHLAALFPSIAAQSRPAARILVVDNHSTDRSREAVGHHAEWIQLDRNYGFAYAVNRGVAAAGTEYVAILNNDVVLEPRWLEELEDAIAAPDVFFACPLLFATHAPQTIDGTWDLLSRSGCPVRALRGEAALEKDSQSPRLIHFAPMTAALFKVALFRRIGPLDEDFVNYLEDVEFGLRAARNGYTGRYVPSARGMHVGSATLGVHSARTIYWNARNQLLLLARHYPARLLRRWWRPIIVGNLLFLAQSARYGHFWAAARGKFEALRQWRRVRVEATLPDSQDARINLETLLAASEREIQLRRMGPNSESFWRIYFALAGKPEVPS